MLSLLDCISPLLSYWEYFRQISLTSLRTNVKKILNHLHSNLLLMKQTVLYVNKNVHAIFPTMIDTLYSKSRLFTIWVQQIGFLIKLFQLMHKIVRHGQIKLIQSHHNFWWLRLFLIVQVGVMSILNTIFITYFQT